MDLMWAQQRGGIAMLALDWRKALDAINTHALVMALGRFGLPARLLEVIRKMYANRRSCVKDAATFPGSSVM